MSAVKLKAVESAAPVVDPLVAARERVADLKRQLAEVEAAVARAKNATSPVEAKASAAQGWRQKLKAIFARQLEAGSLDTATPEIATLTSELASTENDERQADAIAEARRGVVADYQTQAADLRSQLAVAQRALDEARVTALNTEIQELKATYRAAAEAFFRGPHARLLAAGVLSCEMTQNLNAKHGISTQSSGAPMPDRVIVLNPIGFGFADGGGFNQLRIDCGSALAAAYAELKGKWSS